VYCFPQLIVIKSIIFWFVGGVLCPVLTTADGVSNTQLICTLPAGEGAQLPVVVSVGDVSTVSSPVSAVPLSSLFSYLSPVISSVTVPSTGVSPVGGVASSITLTGTSFGLTNSLQQLQLTVNGQQLSSSSSVITTYTDTSIVFIPPPAAFPGAQLTIGLTVAGQTAVLTAAAPDRTSFGCQPSREWTFFGDALFNRSLRPGVDLRRAFSDARTTNVGGSMEGKEVRFGVANSALWAVARSLQPEVANFDWRILELTKK